MDNTFIAGMAHEKEGQPGEFREAARGEGKTALDKTPAIVEAAVVYLKFEYSRPADPGGIAIEETGIRRRQRPESPHPRIALDVSEVDVCRGQAGGGISGSSERRTES